MESLEFQKPSLMDTAWDDKFSWISKTKDRPILDRVDQRYDGCRRERVGEDLKGGRTVIDISRGATSIRVDNPSHRQAIPL